MMLEDVTIPGKDGKPDTIMTKGAIVTSKLFQAAAQGDLTAIKICLDNIDGPPVQRVENVTIDATPLSPEDALRAVQEADESGEV
jgi:hypothetical protein